MNRVSIGIVLLKCCKTQVAEPQKNAKQAEFAKQQAKEQWPLTGEQQKELEHAT